MLQYSRGQPKKANGCAHANEYRSFQSLVGMSIRSACHQPGFAATSCILYICKVIVDLPSVAPLPLSATVAHKFSNQRQWLYGTCTEEAALAHTGESTLHAWQTKRAWVRNKKRNRHSSSCPRPDFTSTDSSLSTIKRLHTLKAELHVLSVCQVVQCSRVNPVTTYWLSCSLYRAFATKRSSPCLDHIHFC